MPKTNHLETTVTNSGDGDTIIKCCLCRATCHIENGATEQERKSQTFWFTAHHQHCGTVFRAYNFANTKFMEAV